MNNSNLADSCAIRHANCHGHWHHAPDRRSRRLERSGQRNCSNLGGSHRRTTEAGVGSPLCFERSGFNVTAAWTWFVRSPGTMRPSGTNGNAISANFDEIRVGGTWESVTSQAVAVPEPGCSPLLDLWSDVPACCRRNVRRSRVEPRLYLPYTLDSRVESTILCVHRPQAHYPRELKQWL
jgi:hypothetical protein